MPWSRLSPIGAAKASSTRIGHLHHSSHTYYVDAMLAAQPVRHVYFGDLPHDDGQAQSLSSIQAVGYFGDTLDWREYYSLGATMPQYFNMMQDLGVDQGVYGHFPMYEDCNGNQGEAVGELSSTGGQSPSSQQALASPLMNSVGTDQASEVAMKEATRCNWYPTEHLRYQSMMGFKEDILRNRNISANEQTFADWAWPPSERNAQNMYQESVVRWDQEAKLGSLGNLPSKLGRIGAQRMTQALLENMPEEDSGNASPSTSASIVSEAEHSEPRCTRVGTAATKSHSKRTAGSMSERTAAGAADTKRQRETLTIEQKRRNHIRHEKKRRGLIKDGFKDLTELVPELRGRTLSRSTILFKAADWLESLIQENEALATQVSALESDKAASVGGTGMAAASHQNNSHKRPTRRRA